MMNPGKMRARIEIQEPPEFTQTQALGPWVTLYKVRAQKKQLRSSEDSAQSGEIGKTIYQFKIRFQKNVTMECRIVQDGNIYDIVGVENVNERNRELILDCVYRSRINVSGI